MELFGVGQYQAARSAYAPQKGEAAVQAGEKKAACAAADTVELSGNAEYLQALQKQFPKMSLSIGTGFTGKTAQNTGGNANRWAFTVSPKLLEKMRADPEAEAEYTQRFRDIARATALAESLSKASGMKTVYCENYIDENGKLHHMSISVREDKVNEKLREEARKNTEEHIERVREKNREAAGKLEELLAKAGENGELTLGGEEMRWLGAAAKALKASEAAEAAQAQESGKADEEADEDDGMSGGRSSVGINAAKLARMLAAAKTRGQVQAVIAKIQADLQECEAGRQQGAEVDEASVEAAERLLQEAKSKLGSAENREATPEEEMASALASLM